MIGRITRRARGVEFLACLRQIEKRVPATLDIHLILDNSATRATRPVREWLEAHPRVHVHNTPTSASWMNAVEGWFAQLERRALRRGTFSSVTELEQALRDFIKAHDKHTVKPFFANRGESDSLWSHHADNLWSRYYGASARQRPRS